MSDQNQPDEESPIMVALRNYVLGHGGLGGTDQKETELAMNVDPSTGTAKGYADGGVVSDDDLQDMPTPNEPAPAATAPAAQAPASPLPGILAQSQALGAQASGGYTPQMRNQLYAAMLQKANSAPAAVGNTLASVGDAIARGYGHDQGANFLQNSIQGTQKAQEQGLGAFDAAQKMALSQTQSGMELGKMDPNSSLSKMSQEAYSGPLKKLGYSDTDIAKMPASQIDAVTQVALKYGDIDAQKELKEATIKLSAAMNGAQIENMKAQREAQKQEIQQKQEELNKAADVEAAKHSFLHPILAHQAAARLAAGSGGSGAAGAAPPHGMTVTQNGHTYTWNPATKKYE